MFFVYAYLYPLLALVLSMLAVHFFPYSVRESAGGIPLAFRLYAAVDYALALFMLMFGLLILRRVVVRAVAFLLFLPLPLTRAPRGKYVIPIGFATAIFCYLLSHMFLPTLIVAAIVALWEVANRLLDIHRRRRGPRYLNER